MIPYSIGIFVIFQMVIVYGWELANWVNPSLFSASIWYLCSLVSCLYAMLSALVAGCAPLKTLHLLSCLIHRIANKSRRRTLYLL